MVWDVVIYYKYAYIIYYTNFKSKLIIMILLPLLLSLCIKHNSNYSKSSVSLTINIRFNFWTFISTYSLCPNNECKRNLKVNFLDGGSIKYLNKRWHVGGHMEISLNAFKKSENKTSSLSDAFMSLLKGCTNNVCVRKRDHSMLFEDAIRIMGNKPSESPTRNNEPFW